MSFVLEIVNIVSPVFLVIGVGYALGRRKFLERDVIDGMSRLVFYVAAPALLFHGAAKADLAEAFDLRIVSVSYAASIITAFGVYFLSARVIPARRGVIAQGSFRSNMFFVGLPVVVNAYGEDVIGPAAVFIGFMVPLINFLSVIVLTMPHTKGGDGAGNVAGRIVKDVFTNPLIISSAAGILFSFFGLTIPKPVDGTLGLIGRVAMPLALLTVGASLDFGKLKAQLPATALTSLIKLIIYPVPVYLVMSALGVSGEKLHFAVILMATPTAVVSHVMAREMKGDDDLAGAVVLGTTIASVLTISGWLAFFMYD